VKASIAVPMAISTSRIAAFANVSAWALCSSARAAFSAARRALDCSLRAWPSKYSASPSPSLITSAQRANSSLSRVEMT